MRSPLRRLTLAAALVVVAGLGAAACGDDDGSTGSTTGAAPTVSGAWARTSPSMATAGAAYLEIKGGSADDALTAASVPADVAATAEVHETVMAGGSGTTMNHGNMTGSGGMATTTMAMGSGSTGSGMMQMREVEKVAVPAGKTVSFAPGGYHIMLLELKKPLTAGQTFTLTLTFEKAGKIDVPVEVRAS